MKKKDDLKINILSSIDEDIIERNSKKRALLMFGGRKRRQKKVFMISGIAAAACLCIVVTTLLMQLLPLPPSVEKQVPIYQGMTVSSLSPTQQAAIDDHAPILTLSAKDTPPRFDLLDNDNSTNNGNGNSQNAPGHNKPEHNPPADTEIAEEVMKNPPEVIGTSEELYYALPNQDIYITVHFHNPDDFEILSFTLNEKKYSSYMFEKGSDMENLILKVNVGDVEGIIEYTIDAIKYIDGTEIKDVIIEGNRTVKVGVFTEKQPTATVGLTTIGVRQINLTLSLADEMELIGISNGFIKAVLTKGENVVGMQDLSLGNDVGVTFGGLRSNTKYKYSIVATYDALDGLGFTSYVLCEEEILTEEYVAFDSVDIGQEGISFGLEWNSALSDEEKKISAIELYLGDEKVRDVDATATTIDGLLSDKEYTVVAHFTNGEVKESISQTFTTKSKAVPDFTLSEIEKTQTSFKFGVDITDVDSVGAITKIELLHGEDESVVADTTDVREFTSLLSDNDYSVRVTYTYDLNDGVGAQTVVKTLDVHTVAKVVPKMELSEANKTQTSFKFDVSISDVDNVGAITKIELLHGNDEPVIADTTDTREFTSLLSDNDYSVRVTYTYDLNDGVGTQTVVKTLDVHTVAKAVPVINITLTQANSYGMKFDLSLTDPDHIGTVTDIIFKDKDGSILASGDVDMRSYDELTVRETYKLTVVCDYNLNDGDGVQQAQKTVDVYAAPNMETPYTVKHYIEELDGSYTLKDTEYYVGEEGADITPATKVYSGFTAPEKQTKLNVRDGSMLVEYYYIRATYTVTYAVNGGDTIQSWSGRYEEAIPYPDATRAGYTFGGWFTDVNLTDNAVNSLTTIPAQNTEVYAWWTEEMKPDAFTISKATSEYIICDYKASATDIIIPSYIGGMPVRTIGARAFQSSIGVTSITLPNTVQLIGDEAFSWCDDLESISIGSGIKTIGASAFYSCKKLTSISIPSSVSRIGAGAFNGCENLTGVYITSISAWCEIEFADENSNPLSTADYLYVNGQKTTQIVIPGSISRLNSYAFCGYSNLTSVTIQEGVSIIDTDAFKKCSNLVQCSIPNSITRVYTGAFAECQKLQYNTYAGGQYLGNNTNPTLVLMIGWGNSSAYAISNTTKIIYAEALRGHTISVTVPESVVYIGEWAFGNMSNVTSITINGKDTYIDEHAFAYSHGLEKVIIGEGVKHIHVTAFASCHELARVFVEGSSSWTLDDTIAYDFSDPLTTAEYFTSFNTHTSILTRS